MSDKSITVTSQLAANSNEVHETSVVPSGQKWCITAFGASDINTGDNKSSVYIFKFGSDIIRIVALTGNTIELPIKEDFTGDGVKKFSVTRYNTSGSAKNCPFWIRAFSRD